VGSRRQRYIITGGGLGHGTLSSPPPLPPPTSRSDLGSAWPTGSSAGAATSTTTTRSAAPVAGQCRWRPESYRFPRRSSPPPDALFANPEFAAAVGVMSTPSASASVPPPATAGSGPPLSLSCIRCRQELPIYLCIHVKNLFPHPICVHRARSCVNPRTSETNNGNYRRSSA